jgi:hypothetical protein
MSRKPYTLAGLHFATQAALEQEIRERLNAQPLNALFWDRLLAEVLNTLHEGIRASKHFATGWFLRLDYEEQVARGMASALRGEAPVLVAEFFPGGLRCEVTAFPWRKNRHRYPDVCEVLTGKPAPRPEEAALDWTGG